MRATTFMREKSVFAALLSLAIGATAGQVNAQADNQIPDIAGTWNGGFSARPVNGEGVPWGEENFPKLNARALAYQEVWEEIIACNSIRPLPHGGRAMARPCPFSLRER
jgi:hypothetical protein